MVTKNSLSRKVFLAFDYLLLSVASILCLYPVIYVIFASFSDSNLLLQNEGLLWKPLSFTVKAYKEVAKNPMILSGYANSIFVLAAGTFLSVVLTSLGAYFLTRKNMMLKKPVIFLVLLPMFFSGGMIPLYLVVRRLGLLDTLGSMFLPVLVSTYNMIIMRTSFESIPSSIEEAAIIDGANDIVVFIKILLPLSKAIIAVMVLYYGVGYWNSYFNAMIYLKDRAKFPLQLVLREILIRSDTSTMGGGAPGADVFAVAESIKYAVIVVATLPILCIYPFLQKYFVKGVMIGAVKE